MVSDGAQDRFDNSPILWSTSFPRSCFGIDESIRVTIDIVEKRLEQKDQLAADMIGFHDSGEATNLQVKAVLLKNEFMGMR